MSREAGYTIQGFLFQFNKTLLEILSISEGGSVTVEGIIEDVDICTPSGKTAIQCKYHETQSIFSLSLLYKPLLQMMVHFKENRDSNVSYILYGYFPNKKPGEKYLLTKEEINKVISTTNKKYDKYLASLNGGFNGDDFLKVLTIYRICYTNG